MSENLRLFTRAAFLLDAVTARVPAGSWDNPTCCSDWSVRQVAGHAAGYIRDLGDIAVDRPLRTDCPDGAILGSHPSREIRQIVNTALTQFDQAGSLARCTETEQGTLSVDHIMGLLWVDPLTHAWDIADATGVPHGIDDGIATRAFIHLQQVSERVRAADLYDEPVPTDSIDVIEMYISFTGRTSVRASAAPVAQVPQNAYDQLCPSSLCSS